MTSREFLPSLNGLYGKDQRRPLYSRVGFLYFLIPPGLKSLARTLLVRGRGSSKRMVVDYLSHIQPSPVVGPQVPLLLTHDVDTAAGLRNLSHLLEREARNGFASLNFLVTHRYPIPAEEMRRAQASGHRFAIHDTTHDNRIAYVSPEAVKLRIRAAREALGSLALSAFRSPAFLRSASLYEGLQGEIEFDFSSPDWALAWPRSGDGIGTPFPFRVGSLICMPTNLPRDGEMLALGMSPEQMLDLVKAKARQLASIGAPVVFLTHPDRGFTDSHAMLGWYETLLGWFKQSGLFLILKPEDTLEQIRKRTREA